MSIFSKKSLNNYIISTLSIMFNEFIILLFMGFYILIASFGFIIFRANNINPFYLYFYLLIYE
jgi:hypothetical protein